MPWQDADPAAGGRSSRRRSRAGTSSWHGSRLRSPGRRRSRRAAGRERAGRSTVLVAHRAHQAIELVVALAPAGEVLSLGDLDAVAAAFLREPHVLRQVAEVAVVVAALLPARDLAIGFGERPQGAAGEKREQHYETL